MPRRSDAPRAAVLFIVVLAVAVLVALLALRPAEPLPASEQPAVPTVAGEVVAERAVACDVPNAEDCERLEVRLVDGASAGEVVEITSGAAVSDADADVGDEVRLVRNEIPAAEGLPEQVTWTITDFERRAPLGWLALVFLAITLLVGRARGARALLGLAASVAVVFGFIVPAILGGAHPAAVALAGALAIMLVTVVVTHGVGIKSVAAVLGTTVSLVLTVLLGAAFVELAHLTGLSSDASSILLAGRDDLSVQGIVLAGLVIGALGVLDDVTVSQASTVLALRHANPSLDLRALFGRALRVGQDHASATVNTLVLAYVGASLPVLLVFGDNGISAGEALNSEPVAQEVVAMLAGSVGLLAAVPMTTWLSAWLALRVEPSQLRDQALHAH